ncbi:hypothetical protein [Phormidium sp. CCY1219]|uniref:hypothetical protein n=1 Tax=Phormidium sp. CCY1219 TaxID=2886104 RepID=UPI002D1F6408|nr:hypothetical protein [Phormidium sp. CCY1219]MEB3830809.1 hypothetical protein [Phormidium sp. CCY1219]
MKLNLNGYVFQIELDFWEQLLAFNLENKFDIPLSHIAKITAEEPPSHWAEIRVPGTYFPGLIKAGTYYTPRGKEFWFVTRDKDYLVLELREEPYQKMVFTVDDNQYWIDKIIAQIQPQPTEE